MLCFHVQKKSRASGLNHRKFALQPMQMRTVSRLSNEGRENTGISERRAEYRRGNGRRERARRRLTLYSAESLQLV